MACLFANSSPMLRLEASSLNGTDGFLLLSAIDCSCFIKMLFSWLRTERSSGVESRGEETYRSYHFRPFPHTSERLTLRQYVSRRQALQTVTVWVSEFQHGWAMSIARLSVSSSYAKGSKGDE